MILLMILLFIKLINGKQFSSSDCGTGDKYLRINNYTVIPHPVKYPGSVTLTIDMDVLKDIPKENTKTRISAERINPSKVRIPCVFGIGSCTVDYCVFWREIYGILPNKTAPDCPLNVGHYVYDRAHVVIPTFGIFNFFLGIIEGDFSANLTFVDSKTSKILGCSHVGFTIDLSNDKKKKAKLIRPFG